MLVVGATLGLIFAGGLVTTRDAGMSVPDWPTTFNYSMFAVPFEKWLGPEAMQSGVFYEHTHRLFASMVGLLTTVLAIWLWMREPRRWMKWLGVGAFLLVGAQAVLGGLRVTHNSLTLAMVHGCTAQTFLCVLVIITAALSQTWSRLAASTATPRMGGITFTSWLLVGTVYAQLILGAVMRHLKAWGAIPTFPQSGPKGEWIPQWWTTGIALNFSHRVGALLITILVLTLITLVFSHAAGQRSLTRPVQALGCLILLQIYLGSNVILKLHPPTITTLHVLTGATILATSLLIALRATVLSSTIAKKTATATLPPNMREATA